MRNFYQDGADIGPSPRNRSNYPIIDPQNSAIRAQPLSRGLVQILDPLVIYHWLGHWAPHLTSDGQTEGRTEATRWHSCVGRFFVSRVAFQFRQAVFVGAGQVARYGNCRHSWMHVGRCFRGGPHAPFCRFGFVPHHREHIVEWSQTRGSNFGTLGGSRPIGRALLSTACFLPESHLFFAIFAVAGECHLLLLNALNLVLLR